MSAKWIGITILIVILAAGAAGFGGYSVGVQNGVQRAQNVRQQFLAERGLAGGQGGQGGQAFAAGAGGQGGQGGNRQFNPDNFAAGQVKSVNGNTIELSTAQSVVKVQVGDKTQIQKMTQGSVSDVQVGERITVQGTRGSDGTMTAQAIQIGGRGGFFGGSPPNGTPQAQTRQ